MEHFRMLGQVVPVQELLMDQGPSIQLSSP